MEVDIKTNIAIFLLSFVGTFLYEVWKDREFWKAALRRWK